jgi:hypothetical protein
MWLIEKEDFGDAFNICESYFTTGNYSDLVSRCMVYSLIKLRKFPKIAELVNSGIFSTSLTLCGIGDPSQAEVTNLKEQLAGVVEIILKFTEDDAVIVTIQPVGTSGGRPPGDSRSSSSSSSPRGHYATPNDNSPKLKRKRKKSEEEKKVPEIKEDKIQNEKREHVLPVQGPNHLPLLSFDRLPSTLSSGPPRSPRPEGKLKFETDIAGAKKMISKQLIMIGNFLQFSPEINFGKTRPSPKLILSLSSKPAPDLKKLKKSSVTTK